MSWCAGVLGVVGAAETDPAAARPILSQYSAKISRKLPQHFSGTVIAVRNLFLTCKSIVKR